MRKRKKKTKSVPINRTGNAIIYVRVSTDAQVQGTSLDDQLRQCREALAKDGKTVVQEFRDEGTSAKTADDRAVLMEAIDFALKKKNAIEVLMVWKVDRFARFAEDHFAIRRMLRLGGVELRSATEPIGDDPSSKLFETMIAGFAEFDNSIRALRASNGMRARIREGVWPFRPPPGYITQSLKKQGLKKSRPDPIDPVLFPVIQQLLKGFARGVYTQTDMMLELGKSDFTAHRGSKVTLQLIDRMTSDHLRFYAGWLPDAFGEQIEYHRGLHVPMITDAEMYAIEAIRLGRPRAGISHQRQNDRFPLRGTLRCIGCAQPMTASHCRGRSKHYDYYHCFQKGCLYRNKGIKVEAAHAAFELLLHRLQPKPEVFEALAASITECGLQRASALEMNAAAVSAQLQQLEARRRKVCDLAESGSYDPETVTERLRAIDVEVGALKAKDLGRQPERSNPVNTLQEARAAIDGALQNWSNLDLPLKQRFEKIAWPEGIFLGPKCEISNPKMSSIFRLNLGKAPLNSVEVRREGFEPS